MEEWFRQYRNLLFRLAYQLTGSAADAEDVVQDVFLKLHDADPARLTEPKAYLCRMVTNRCIDLQKSARKRREQYFGPWLPEPIAMAAAEESVDGAVERRGMLAYGMLVLLERLTPAERAVFVLREALGFDYPDIAKLLDKREPACRQLMSRARNKTGIADDEPAHAEPPSEAWVGKFVAELASGNVDRVVSLLAEDVVLVSDGGGKRSAAARPIESPDRVARCLLGLAAKATPGDGYRFELAVLNGGVGMLIHSDEGIETAILFEVADGLLSRCYFVRNPDKLAFMQSSILPGR